VDEWQSADERNNREKISRARQAAEDLFKPGQANAAAEVTRLAPNGGAPVEQQQRRQPRIFTIPSRLPPSPEVEAPVAAEPEPIRRRAVARRPTVTVPPSQIGRVRALATYGMTPVQVAELYGVTADEIDRILKAPIYKAPGYPGKSR
jgi:hypothetical protein